MIIKTYENELEGILNKIGFSKRSFTEWGTQLKTSFNEGATVIEKFKNALSTAFTVQKQTSDKWVKTSSGEIVTDKNVDSYLPTINDTTANNTLKYLQSIQSQVNKGTITWNDYFNTFKGTNQEYLIDFVQNTDLQTASTEDLVKANQQAREAAIAHNQALKQQTLGAKAGQIALKGLALAGNMLAMLGISKVISESIELFSSLENKEKQVAENAANMASSLKELHNSYGDGSKKIIELSARYDELSKGVSSMGYNISLTDEQYTEYKNIIYELSELMPNLNTLFNEHGEKIGFVTGKLKNASDEYRKYIQTKAQDYLLNGDSEKNTYQDILDSYDYSNGRNATTWSKAWREAAGITMQFASLYDFVRGFAGDNNPESVDWTSELFGAEKLYTEHEQLDILKKLAKAKKEEWSGILNDSSYGDSRQTNLVEDMFKIDVDKIDTISDDEYKQIQAKLETKIVNLENTLESKAKDITLGMSNILLANDDYWAIENDDTKNALSTMISGLNRDILESLNIDLSDQLSIETWVTGLIDSIKSNEGNVADALNNLFKLDIKKLNPKEAKNIAEQYLSIITNAMYGGFANDKQIELIKKTYGFDIVDENYNAYNNSLSASRNRLNARGYDDKGFKLNDDGAQLDIFWSENIKTMDDVALWDRVTGNINNVTDAIAAFNKEKTTTTSFNSIWNSLDTSVDEADKEAKTNLLELAEAGKLTEEAFKQSSIADTFTDAGYSIEEATKKINALADETKQLSALRTGITAITSAYDEKNSKKTVSASILNSMGETLGVSEWNNKDIKVWEKYKAAAADSTKDAKKFKEAQDALTTAFINNGSYLSNLTDKNQDYYKGLLKEMGITNASAIIKQQLIINEDKLTQKKINARLAALDLSSASETETADLGAELAMLYGTSEALGNYALKKQLANEGVLDTSQSIQNLIALAEQCGASAQAVNILTSMQKNQLQLESLSKSGDRHAPDIAANIESENKGLKAELNELLSKKAQPSGTDISNGSGTGGSDNNKADSYKTSASKLFNWIETRIDRLERKISKATQKAEASYRSFTARQKSYSKAIALTNKEISAQEKLAEKSLQKADKVKLSKSLKNKARNGSLDIDNIKSQKTQGQIEKYLEYYSQYLEASDKAAELKLSNKENRRKKLELSLTEYDTQSSSLKNTNELISSDIETQKELGNYKLSKSYASLNANAKANTFIHTRAHSPRKFPCVYKNILIYKKSKKKVVKLIQ